MHIRQDAMWLKVNTLKPNYLASLLASPQCKKNAAGCFTTLEERPNELSWACEFGYVVCMGMECSPNLTRNLMALRHHVKQCRFIVSWTIRNERQSIFHENTTTTHVIEGNEFEKVICKMLAFFSRPQFVYISSPLCCVVMTPWISFVAHPSNTLFPNTS